MYKITKTDELKAIGEVNAMNTYAEDALGQFKQFIQNAYDVFWYGEVSPKIKVALLGTEAIRVFTDSAEAQAFLASKIEGYVPAGVPNGYEVKFKKDGSAEITGELVVEDSQEFPVLEEEQTQKAK